jgi:hypothetical protein
LGPTTPYGVPYMDKGPALWTGFPPGPWVSWGGGVPGVVCGAGGGRGCRWARAHRGDPGGCPGWGGAGWGAVGWVGVGVETLAQNTRWRVEGLAQNLGQLAQNYWAGGRVAAPKWGAGGAAGGVPHPSPFRAYSMGDTVSKQTPSGLKSDLCLSTARAGAGGKPFTGCVLCVGAWADCQQSDSSAV